MSGQLAYQAVTFGEWLRTTRQARGMEKKELAERAGINRGTLTVYEKGELPGGMPPVEMFQRIAHGLELDLGYVLYKAGFAVGRDGVDMERLAELEATMDILAEQEALLRSAMAEAMRALDTPVGVLERDAIEQRLGRALGVLDLVTTRLRERRST